jgi:hypothetical protein
LNEGEVGQKAIAVSGAYRLVIAKIVEIRRTPHRSYGVHRERSELKSTVR